MQLTFLYNFFFGNAGLLHHKKKGEYKLGEQ